MRFSSSISIFPLLAALSVGPAEAFSPPSAGVSFPALQVQNKRPSSGYFPIRQQQVYRGQTDTTTNTITTLSMAVEGDFDPESLEKAREEAQVKGSIKARLRSLYKFTRPHTIRGTILASIAGTIRALVDTPGAIANAQWGYMLPRAFLGMFALLLGNAFIVGINQIYDEDIDRLNKPFLPVANGEMSKRFAWIAVLTSGILGPIVV